MEIKEHRILKIISRNVSISIWLFDTFEFWTNCCFRTIRFRWIDTCGRSECSMNRYFRCSDKHLFQVHTNKWNQRANNKCNQSRKFTSSWTIWRLGRFSNESILRNEGTALFTGHATRSFLGSDEPNRKSGREQMMMHYLKPIYLNIIEAIYYHDVITYSHITSHNDSYSSYFWLIIYESDIFI